jgi:uncharacterized protein involved in outer membrane biogenesis
MRRILLISLAALAALLIALFGVGAWMLNDEGFLKNRLSGLAMNYTGRELNIAGPLEIDLGRETRIEAFGISFSNAAWAKNPQMVTVGHLEITLVLPSLLFGPVEIPALTLRDCAVELLKNADGEANWVFSSVEDLPKPPGQGEMREPPVALESVTVERCDLLLEGPERSRPLELRFEHALLDRTDMRVFTDIAGRVDGEELKVEGWLEPVSALREGGGMRFDLAARAGGIALESRGSFANANTLSGPTIETRFHGPDIGRFIDVLAWPRFSEGPFDFQARLSTESGKARIEVDGDLGSLQVDAHGVIDQNAKASAGQVQFDIAGPDLGALAEVFKLRGVVREPFEATAVLGFEGDRIKIENGSLKTGGDRLTVGGSVVREKKMAGTRLTIGLSSEEMGRWAPLWGEESRVLGAIDADGQLTIEPGGLLYVDARAKHGQSELAAKGIAAALAGPAAPDLDFDFHSNELPWLASLAGFQDFPDRPLALSGRLKKSGPSIRITGFDLSFDTATATGDATVVLEPGFDGSRIDTQIDIPDLAGLGMLFGVSDLPRERLQTHVSARIEGAGLAFKAGDGSLGENRIDVEGRIADLGKPALVDASFDIRLPGLQFIQGWAPGLDLPDGRFEARGRLRNQGERVDIEQTVLTFNNASATVAGYFTQNKHFDLEITAKDPQAANLKSLAKIDLPEQPFAVGGHAIGDLSRFLIQDLELSYGNSVITGDLSLEFGETRKISGELHAALVDLDWLEKKNAAQEPEKEKPKTGLLFDDTPVQETTDTGIEIDTKIEMSELRLAGSRYEDLEFGIFLSPERLELNPFRLKGFRGGAIDGVLLLVSGGERPRLEVSVEANGIKPGLAAAPGQDPATLPTIDAEIDLQGSGRTYRDLAAGLSGKIRVKAGPGQVAKSGLQFLLNDFVDQLLTTLNPFAKQSDFTQLECAVAAADIVDGQVRLDPMVVHLREITILSQGDIDLDDESIDINFVSKPRRGLGISASDLVNPFIRVGGTLAEPSLALDAADTVVQGGLAAATGGLSILANSLAKRFLSSRDPCGKALKEIEERDSG